MATEYKAKGKVNAKPLKAKTSSISPKPGECYPRPKPR